MRVISKICLIALVIVMALPVQKTLALPDSTFAEAEGNWQGTKFYRNDENTLYARVDFTVYDTANTGAEADFVTSIVDELSLTGQYIYAYQVWNSGTQSTESIESFGLTNLDGTDITQSLDDSTSYDDQSGYGVEPNSVVADEALWEFDWQGDGELAPDKRSWFLLYSSDFAPIAGDFKIRTFESDDNVDIPLDPDSVSDPETVPEPVTLILMGLGSTIVLKRRRRFV